MERIISSLGTFRGMNRRKGMDTNMAKKKSNNDLGETSSTEFESDTDEGTDNPLAGGESEPDTDEEEDIFEFDAALLPQGVKLVDLAPDFVRPEGFLMVPRINKKTGEISPMTTTFAGIVHDIVPWTDNRGKARVWFACEATADVPGTFYTGKDENDRDFKKPLVKGTRIGISGSGAINALKTKKGHFVALHWTGRKVSVKNGEMWQVIAQVSDVPVIEQKAAT
jgi:hypothetical protein